MQDGLLTMVTIKNISVTPDVVSHNGKHDISVSCIVFTANEKASIESVFIDLYHSQLFSHYPMTPIQILQPTNDGEYSGTFSIPILMDTGVYHLPIVAIDSLNSTGRSIGQFSVTYSHNNDSPFIYSSEFKTQFETITQTSFIPNNAIEVLENGNHALLKRLELIQSAKKQINLQTYILGHTGDGGKLLDALLQKSDEGVEVNIILNADTQIPTSAISTLRLKMNQYFHELAREDESGIIEWISNDILDNRLKSLNKTGGINLVLFDAGLLKNEEICPVSNQKQTDHWLEKSFKEVIPQLNDLTRPKDWQAFFKGPGGLPSLPLLDYAIHEKIMVVDDQFAIVGGRNLEDHYFSSWVDLDLFIQGPLVQNIQDGFFKTFQLITTNMDNERKSPITSPCESKDNCLAMFIQSRPWKREYQTLHSLIYAIQCSKKRICIRSQYVVLPDSLLRDALMDAVRRGVVVRIITNSYRTSKKLNMGAGYYVTLHHLEKLLDAGIQVFEHKGIDKEDVVQPYHHTKEFIFDGHLCAIGSFNLSLRSCYIESENLVYICDPLFSAKREVQFLSDMNCQTIEITNAYYADLKKQFKRRIELSQYVDLLF